MTKDDFSYLDAIYKLNNRIINPIACTIEWKGEIKPLRRKELELLDLLITSKKEIVLRNAIIDDLWDGNTLVGEPGLNNAIYKLRRSIDDNDPNNPMIRTIPRRGYQFKGNAEFIENNQPLLPPHQHLSNNLDCNLVRILSKSEIYETWLAKNDKDDRHRIFRLCLNENQLKNFSIEIDILNYLKKSLKNRKDIVTIIDSNIQKYPYFIELPINTFHDLQSWAPSIGGLINYPIKERVRLLTEFTKALYAVHEVGVVHQNINSNSMFLNEIKGVVHAKIGNFDQSEFLDFKKHHDSEDASACLNQTIKINRQDTNSISSEMLTVKASSLASDIFDLGILIYQMIIGDLNKEVDTEFKSSIDSDVLMALVKDCLVKEPSKRPATNEIYKRLLEYTNEEQEIINYQNSKTSTSAILENQSFDSFHLLENKNFDSFHLLEKIGEGGMGMVYLAEQREPIERQVAIKLIKTGLDTKQVLARFETEQQLLALMQHENVASVYGAGCDNESNPYFIMEYVKGSSFTIFCDEYKLIIQERIQLFLQVCDGVQHAHQKGVIHRDLNPKNIMVKSNSTRSTTVKIIDFGVAKSLQCKLTSHNLFTRLGTFVGTPPYVSPEQIAGNKRSIDTRSDIYSLGVILFELLLGVPTYTKNDLQEMSSLELMKMLNNKEIEKPIDKFLSLDESTKTAIATSRKLTVDQLALLLRSDLSWIPLKCLEINPNDRYDSVAELKNDLNFWLQGLPIKARKNNGNYVFKKFLNKHRKKVTMVAMTILALATTIFFAIIGYNNTNQALDEAREALLEAELVANFQMLQFQSIEPSNMAAELRETILQSVLQKKLDAKNKTQSHSLSKQQLNNTLAGINFTDISLKQIESYFFNPAMDVIKNNFVDHPKVQSRLWQSIANMYVKLGLVNKAILPQKMALEQRKNLLGENHRLTLISQRHKGNLLKSLGKLEQARVTLISTMVRMKDNLGEMDPETFTAISDLAAVLVEQGKIDEAEIYFREVLKGRIKTLGPDDPRSLKSIHDIGLVYWHKQMLNEAQVYFKKSLDRRRFVLGNLHLDTLESINDNGIIFWKLGMLDKAELYYLEAFEGYRVILGEKHPNSLKLMNNLAVLYKSQYRFEEAENLHRKSLNISKLIFGIDHPNTLRSLSNLASVLRQQGKTDEAFLAYKESILGKRKILGDTHPSTLTSISNLAFLEMDLFNLKKAESLFTEVLKARIKTLGEKNPSTMRSMNNLAILLRNKGQYAESKKLQNKSLEMQIKVLGQSHPDTLRSMSHLALTLFEHGEIKSSEILFRSTLVSQTENLGDNHLDTLITKHGLIESLLFQKMIEESLQLSEELVNTSTHALNKGNKHIGVFLIDYGYSLMYSGFIGKSEEAFEKALENMMHLNSTCCNKSLTKLLQGLVSVNESKHKVSPLQNFDQKATYWNEKLKNNSLL